MKKFLAVILTIIILAGGGFIFLNRRGNNETSTKFDSLNFISEGDTIDKKDFDIIDGQYYLSLDYIKEYIDSDAAYDKNEKTVIFTNDKGTKRYIIGEMEGLANSNKIALRDPIIEKDGKILVPIEAFLYDYPIEFRYLRDEKLLLLDRKDVNYAIGVPTGNGVNMREKASMKAPLVAILNSEDRVYVYGEEGDFYHVRLIDGYEGYISKKLLKVEYGEDLFTKEKEISKEAGKPLNLTWDYTYGPEKEEKINLITGIKGLDIICPTWFSVVNSNGDLTDRGNIEYVNKYNNFGIEVWGYLDNSFNADLTTEILTKSSKREKIIAKTLELTKKYKMPGINIDFENIATEDRGNFTQFVRELAAEFHANGIKVSVDVTPQISTDITKEKYDREAIAKVVDYVVVMTYDQHWGSSDKAGSVAEYKWVESNINMLARQIPSEKFILGVPFYSRIWTENNGKTNSNTLSMIQSYNLIKEKGLVPKWDNVAKQDYIEYSENGSTKKIWIEDRASIDWKISLVNKYNLAGIGTWRKGFETQDVWSVINKRLK